MQTHTDNQTPRGDILKECFRDRVNHITKEEILGYRVDEAVMDIFLTGARLVLSPSEIVERVKANNPDLAEVPNIENLVSSSLETGCTKDNDIEFLVRYDFKILTSYKISVPYKMAEMMRDMYNAFLEALENSDYGNLMNPFFHQGVVDFSEVGINYSKLGVYYMNLVFKMFKKDKIWSEEMYHCFLKDTLATSHLSNGVFYCISFLEIIGTEYPIVGFQFSRHIDYFLNLLKPCGFSLYSYCTELDQHDMHALAYLHYDIVEINPEDYCSEWVGVEMLSLMLERLTVHSGESKLRKSDFITGILQRCPKLKSYDNLESIVSSRLLSDTYGENRFYGYLKEGDETYYFLDRFDFPIESAETFRDIWSGFFNNFTDHKIDTISLANLEILDMLPGLAKYYVPLVFVVFRSIKVKPEDCYNLYTKILFSNAQFAPEKLRLFINHFFILGKIDPMFVKGLMYYLIPFLNTLQTVGSNIFENTETLTFESRTN